MRCQSTHPNWMTARVAPVRKCLLQDRLKAGRERLEEAREAIALLCEPVQPPKGVLEHIHYSFAAISRFRKTFRRPEPRRVALYSGTAALMRAYANIANDLQEAGYSNTEIVRLKQEVNDTLKLATRFGKRATKPLT